MAIWPFLSQYNKQLDSSFPDGNMAVSITVLQAIKLDSSCPEDDNMAVSIMVLQAIKPDCSCLAQTRIGIGSLGKPPAVKQFPSVESHLGVRASFATRRKQV
jgi:hypothetical protein